MNRDDQDQDDLVTSAAVTFPSQGLWRRHRGHPLEGFKKNKTLKNNAKVGLGVAFCCFWGG